MTTGASAQTDTARNRISAAPATSGARRSTDKGDLPTEILDRYLIERDRRGRPERFFRDHRASEPMFRDQGRSLSSDRPYPDAIAAMLKIATHRGWTIIRVSGDDAFRREVWIQAQGLELEVRGHRPSDRDRQAAGEPRRPHDPAHDAADFARRREMAAVVVRTLIADPAAQARLLDRLGLRSPIRSAPEAEREPSGREPRRTR